MLQFQRVLSNKFPSLMVVDDEEENEEEMETIRGGPEDPFEEDSDGPVVVDMVDVQASLARTSNENTTSRHQDDARHQLPSSVIAGYPLLVAAILPQEDILMTCARALDEKKDVSLVREAAAYLEEMEQQKF
jgi:hypothetical protein